MHRHPRASQSLDQWREISEATLATVLVTGPAASQDAPGTVRIETFSKDRTERSADLDLGRRGASLGDRVMARGPLYDPSTPSRRIGSFIAELVSLNPRSLLTQVTLTVVLPDGPVAIGGSLPFRHTLRASGAVLPVTGGTGAHAGASGTATMRARKIGGDEGFSLSLDLEGR